MTNMEVSKTRDEALKLKMDIIIKCAAKIERFLAFASHNEIHDLLSNVKIQAKDSKELLSRE